MATAVPQRDGGLRESSQRLDDSLGPPIPCGTAGRFAGQVTRGLTAAPVGGRLVGRGLRRRSSVATRWFCNRLRLPAR